LSIRQKFENLSIPIRSAIIGFIFSWTYLFGVFNNLGRGTWYEFLFDFFTYFWWAIISIIIYPYCYFNSLFDNYCGEQEAFIVMYLGFIIAPLLSSALGYIFGKYILGFNKS